MEMFKIKNNLSPAFISDLFSQIGTRTRSNALFLRPNVNTTYMGEQSLRYFGPIVWDTMVPENLKGLTDLNDFKNKIKLWLPRNCACRLCKDYIQYLGFATLYE